MLGEVISGNVNLGQVMSSYDMLGRGKFLLWQVRSGYIRLFRVGPVSSGHICLFRISSGYVGIGQVMSD
jgi:hypothetical protein